MLFNYLIFILNSLCDLTAYLLRRKGGYTCEDFCVADVKVSFLEVKGKNSCRVTSFYLNFSLDCYSENQSCYRWQNAAHFFLHFLYFQCIFHATLEAATCTLVLSFSSSPFAKRSSSGQFISSVSLVSRSEFIFHWTLTIVSDLNFCKFSGKPQLRTTI